MAPRDYKHANTAPRRNARAKPPSAREPHQGSWLSFLSGLGVGLLVAFGVYLWAGQLPPPAAMVDSLGDRFNNDSAYSGPGEEHDVSAELPRPTFDFYKILPEMEVPIPDWGLPDKEAPVQTPDPDLAPGAYLLQVGSFKSFEDADRAKASLALRGITASIQRVVINGQDVWFRVHVGPLSDIAEIRAMRVKLIENDMDFILLRIGGGDAAVAP